MDIEELHMAQWDRIVAQLRRKAVGQGRGRL